MKSTNVEVPEQIINVEMEDWEGIGDNFDRIGEIVEKYIDTDINHWIVMEVTDDCIEVYTLSDGGFGITHLTKGGE